MPRQLIGIFEEVHTWDKAHLLDLSGKVKRRDGNPLVIRIPGPEVSGPLFAEVGDK